MVSYKYNLKFNFSWVVLTNKKKTNSPHPRGLKWSMFDSVIGVAQAQLTFSHYENVVKGYILHQEISCCLAVEFFYLGRASALYMTIDAMD